MDGLERNLAACIDRERSSASAVIELERRHLQVELAACDRGLDRNRTRFDLLIDDALRR